MIACGMSNAQACRIVGINARTGKRWRHGRTITSSSGRRLHYPPVINAREREISSRFLSEDERVGIADLRRRGLGVRAIAAATGRSPATISRELRRNLDPTSGHYRPFTAQRLLTFVDLADGAVIRVADEHGVEGPRPLVADGAVVGFLPGSSAW